MRSRASTTAALVATAVAMLAVALLLTPAATSAGNPDPNLERDLVALTNVDRTSNGLGALLDESRLIGLARERSDDMLIRDYFSHDIPPAGEKVFAEMGRRGIRYELAGENLEWNGSARAATVQFARQDFMNSPTHRANVLRDVFTRIGVGAIPGTNRVMFTVLFMKPAAGDPAAAPAPPPAPAPVSPPAIAPLEIVAEVITVEEGGDFASPFEVVIDTTIGRSLGVPGRE